LPSKPPETDLKRLRFSVLSILLPWLYFMSTSLNIPSLPKFVNAVINKGSTDVTDASATVYGNLAGIDALFTFLSVNLVGVLSDRFGRRPFMLMSSIGMQCVHL
jgi:MFS family permease